MKKRKTNHQTMKYFVISVKLSKRQTEGFKSGFIIEIGTSCKKCGRTMVIRRCRI